MSVSAQIEREVLSALDDAVKPMSRSDILEYCQTAEDAQQISLTLSALKKKGVVESPERGLWVIAAGRRAAMTATDVEPSADSDENTDGSADEDPVFAELNRLRLRRAFPAADYRAQICQALAEHELTEEHPRLREFFERLAEDLQAAA